MAVYLFKYKSKLVKSLPSAFFPGSREIVRIHEEIEPGKVYYDVSVSRRWNLFHSSSCSCDESKDVIIKVVTGLSNELYSKSDSEINATIGIGLASISSKVSTESGENFAISIEQSIEDKTTFHAPECGRKKIYIYQLITKWHIKHHNYKGIFRKRREVKQTDFDIGESQWYFDYEVQEPAAECGNCQPKVSYGGIVRLEVQNGTITIPGQKEDDGTIRAYGIENRPLSIGDKIKLDEIEAGIPEFLKSESGEKAKLMDYKLVKGLPTQEPTKRKIAVKHEAIIIGINEYRDKRLEKLEGAENDAEELSIRLRDFGKFRIQNGVNLLLGSEATSHNIRQAISSVLLSMNPNDLAIIYFTGHGFKDRYGGAYIAPYDFDVDRPFVHGISMNDLRQLFDRSSAIRIALFLDCVFSSQSLKPANEVDKLSDESTQFEKQLEILSGQGKLILAAGRKDQDSKETSDPQHIKKGSHYHGGFTQHLIEALNGKASENGVITLNSLFNYVEKEMAGAKQKLISVEADKNILDTQIAAVPF